MFNVCYNVPHTPKHMCEVFSLAAAEESEQLTLFFCTNSKELSEVRGHGHLQKSVARARYTQSHMESWTVAMGPLEMIGHFEDKTKLLL